MQERFKQLLEEKNLTATKFASLIKVNASAMSHILNGRSKPGFDVLDKIGQAFPEVNLNWLISGKGNMYLSAAPVKKQIAPEPAPVNQEVKEVATPATPAPPVPPPPASAVFPSPEVAAVAAMSPAKKLKRIILFFEDGSFEDYLK